MECDGLPSLSEAAPWCSGRYFVALSEDVALSVQARRESTVRERCTKVQRGKDGAVLHDRRLFLSAIRPRKTNLKDRLANKRSDQPLLAGLSLFPIRQA